jgi:hypothetical protein
MRDAEIFDDADGLRVALYKEGVLFGIIDMKGHSIIYAKEVVVNWENGILQDDNTFIERV